MSVLRTVLPVAAGLALLAPTAVAAQAAPAAAPAAVHQEAAPAAAVPGPRTAVTWKGWRGVDFGTSLAAAQRRLGGSLEVIDPSGGCGDVLTTPTGTLDGVAYRRSHAVGTIRVRSGIDYPLGVDQRMSPAEVAERAEGSDFILRTKRVATPDGGHLSENRVVGPYGRTLYFLYVEGTDRIDRMGVSVNRHVALEQMELNGC